MGYLHHITYREHFLFSLSISISLPLHIYLSFSIYLSISIFLFLSDSLSFFLIAFSPSVPTYAVIVAASQWSLTYREHFFFSLSFFSDSLSFFLIVFSPSVPTYVAMVAASQWSLSFVPSPFLHFRKNILPTFGIRSRVRPRPNIHEGRLLGTIPPPISVCVDVTLFLLGGSLNAGFSLSVSSFSYLPYLDCNPKNTTVMYQCFTLIYVFDLMGLLGSLCFLVTFSFIPKCVLFIVYRNVAVFAMPLTKMEAYLFPFYLSLALAILVDLFICRLVSLFLSLFVRLSQFSLLKYDTKLAL